MTSCNTFNSSTWKVLWIEIFARRWRICSKSRRQHSYERQVRLDLKGETSPSNKSSVGENIIICGKGESSVNREGGGQGWNDAVGDMRPEILKWKDYHGKNLLLIKSFKSAEKERILLLIRSYDLLCFTIMRLCEERVYHNLRSNAFHMPRTLQ